MLSRDDRRVDFAWPAHRVAWHINGMTPWPGVKVTCGDDSITLSRARPSDVEMAAGTTAGDVILADADSGLPESGLASERARSPSDRSPGHADAVGLEVPRRWRPA
jgi:hypothetical protein